MLTPRQLYEILISPESNNKTPIIVTKNPNYIFLNNFYITILPKSVRSINPSLWDLNSSPDYRSKFFNHPTKFAKSFTRSLFHILKTDSSIMDSLVENCRLLIDSATNKIDYHQLITELRSFNMPEALLEQLNDAINKSPEITITWAILFSFFQESIWQLLESNPINTTVISNESTILYADKANQNKVTFMPKMPLYVDKYLIESLYEQIQVYDSLDLYARDTNHHILPQKLSIKNTVINNRPLEQSLQNKVTNIILATNGQTLTPRPLYDTFYPKPKSKIVYIKAPFLLEGVYAESCQGNLLNSTLDLYSSKNYAWHFIYKNIGINGTYYYEGHNRLKCTYANGRDAILNISMNLDGSKFLIGARHMTHSIYNGAEFNLIVLGYVLYSDTSTQTYSIKPLEVELLLND